MLGGDAKQNTIEFNQYERVSLSLKNVYTLADNSNGMSHHYEILSIQKENRRIFKSCQKNRYKIVIALFSVVAILALFCFLLFKFLAIAIGDNSGNIKVFDGDGNLQNEFKAHTSQINRLKCLPHGLVASSSDDATIKIWNSTSDWSLLTTYTGHRSATWAIEYVGDEMIASGAAMPDSTIQIWSMITGERKSKPIVVSSFTSSFTNYVFALKMLPNGLLASGISYTWLNAEIKIWDISNGRLSRTFECTSKIKDLELINNETLASSSDDGTVMLWNLTDGTLWRQFKAHNSSVNKIKIISSHLIATGSLDKTIKIWNVTSGSLERTLNGHTDKICYSLDRLGEDFLVSGSFDNYINQWRISTGSLVKKRKTASQINALVVL